MQAGIAIAIARRRCGSHTASTVTLTTGCSVVGDHLGAGANEGGNFGDVEVVQSGIHLVEDEKGGGAEAGERGMTGSKEGGREEKNGVEGLRTKLLVQ